MSKHKMKQARLGKRQPEKFWGCRQGWGMCWVQHAVWVNFAAVTNGQGIMNESPLRSRVFFSKRTVLFGHGSPGKPQSTFMNCLCCKAELLLLFSWLYVKAGDYGGKQPFCQNRCFCKKFSIPCFFFLGVGFERNLPGFVIM